jgi:hypothetical protein
MLLMISWRACGGLQPVLVHCCKTLLVLMIYNYDGISMLSLSLQRIVQWQFSVDYYELNIVSVMI